MIEICNKLLLCSNFNDALTYRTFSSFKSCESVVPYINLLAVASKWSRFCKMVRRSKVVEPRSTFNVYHNFLKTVNCQFFLCFYIKSTALSSGNWPVNLKLLLAPGLRLIFPEICFNLVSQAKIVHFLFHNSNKYFKDLVANLYQNP